MLQEEPADWNLRIDRAIKVLEVNHFNSICKHTYHNLNESDYWNWLGKTDLPFKELDFVHKKALEFFFSTELLDISSSDTLLDAAGGRSGYLQSVQITRGCRNNYLNDHIYSGINQNDNGITMVGGDVASINLPDESLTKIACHHAFEHFQADKDIDFIFEVARLLKVGGRACIIPLFLVDTYTECWNIDHSSLYDNKAQLIVDKSASIPGGDEDGHFARFYDLQAFNYRILQSAQNAGLIPAVATCRLDGKDLPPMKKNFGSVLNYPLRALLLEKPNE